MRAIIKLKHRALSCGTWDGVELRRGAQETDNVSWKTWEKIKASGDPIELVREIHEEEDLKALETVEEPKAVEPEVIETNSIIKI